MSPLRLLRFLPFPAFCLAASLAFGAIDDSVDALTKKYGKPEPDTYRPDLYPTSYRFKPRGIEIGVTPFADRAKKIDVFFKVTPFEAPETLLVRYSGRRDWKPLPATDPLFAKHFQGFDPEAKGNALYSCGTAVALVQRDVGFGKLVLWIQTSDYPELLVGYRQAKKNP